MLLCHCGLGLGRKCTIVGFIVVLLYTVKIHNKASRDLESHLYNLQLQSSHLPPLPTVAANNCTRAALILFGVPKQFSFVWKSYMLNIIMRNPRIEFEVYMHMYSDLHQKPFSNRRNKEFNATLESPDEIQAILDKGDITVMLTTSLQSMFEESELSWLEQNDTSFFHRSYTFQTLQNMFRQGNSLKEAFQNHQRHNNNHSNDDIVYIFARSDTFLMSPVDIPCSGFGNHVDIVVPRWAGANNGGYNDRFAVAAGQLAAKVYVSKVEGYKEAILALRSKPSFTTSEILLKNWLVLGHKLNVTEVEDIKAWALLRVRADGRIDFRDVHQFGIKNASLPHLVHQLGI